MVTLSNEPVLWDMFVSLSKRPIIVVWDEQIGNLGPGLNSDTDTFVSTEYVFVCLRIFLYIKTKQVNLATYPAQFSVLAIFDVNS